MIKIKRIYDSYSPDDGYRILIDRLWPRGIKKEGSHIDKWFKDIAPSTELRKWFGHDPEKWEEFRRKYHTELSGSVALKELAADIDKHKVITLLFGSKELTHNHAIVLQQFINQQLPG